MAWDRYAYVKNNPINLSDPSGNKACSNDGNGFDSCSDDNRSANELAKEFGVELSLEESYISDGNAIVAAIAYLAMRLATLSGLSPIATFINSFGNMKIVHDPSLAARFFMYLICCSSYCFWYSFTLSGSYSTLYFNIRQTTRAIACAVATVA